MVFREQLNVDRSRGSLALADKSDDQWMLSRRCGLLLLVMLVIALLGSALVGHLLTAAANNSGTCEQDSTQQDGYDKQHKHSPTRPSDVRLPSHLRPLVYNVRLLPFIEEGNFSVHGQVEVLMKADSAGDNVTIHVKNMVIQNDSVEVMDESGGRQMEISSYEYDTTRQFFIVKLKAKVEKDKAYRIKIKFIGELNSGLAGFYRSSYIDRDGTKKWLAVTQFQPTDARRAFPCFDEPALKAKFNITLGRKKHMRSVSNMPVDKSVPIDNMPGYEWDIFKQTVPMSTYLVAFLVSDFAMKKAEPGASETLFRVWSRPQAIQQAEYARRIGPQILNYFEQFFQTDFPLPKQDMVALPDFSAGAMENWGLITYRETALLYEEGVSSSSNKQRVAVVVSHELAHQWFGNLVTPYWWTDLWLNEGFASYVEFLGVDKVEPGWKMMEQFVTEDVQQVMSTDALESSHPISIPVNHPDEINEIFDSISYKKGASIIRMMNHYLTTETMRKGLTNYLSQKKYQAATQDDLWAALTKQAHKDSSLPRNLTVKTIMDTWTLQMGYPVLDVKRDYEKGTALVTQSRFLLNGAKTSKDFKWWIPITFTQQQNPDFNDTKTKYWMSTDEQMTVDGLPQQNQWVIFNLQEHGYYKVNYDQQNWDMIINQMKTNHRLIHTVNRAQIIDDTFDLARAGRLNYDTLFRLLTYMKEEVEYSPWRSTLTNLEYINRQLGRSTGYGEFRTFILKLIEKQYASIGYDEKASDSHLDRFKRIQILKWACKVGHPDCVRRSKQLFADWMAYPQNTSLIPANKRFLVYCTAIREGNEREWDFAWLQFGQSNVAAEKKRIMSALGCTKELWLLSRYLGWLLPEKHQQRKIRIQDGTTVFTSVAFNPIGRDLAFAFLRNKWNDVVATFGGGAFQLARFIGTLKTGYNTDLELDQLRQFQRKHSDDLVQARREMDQVIEQATTNNLWMRNNYRQIVDLLNKYA